MNTPRHAESSAGAPAELFAPGTAGHMQHPQYHRPAAPYGSTFAAPLLAAWEVSVKVLVPASAMRTGRKEDLLVAWCVLESTTHYAWACGLHTWGDVGTALGGVAADDAILRAVQRHALVQARACVAATLSPARFLTATATTGGASVASPQPAHVTSAESRASREFWWRVRSAYGPALALLPLPGSSVHSHPHPDGMHRRSRTAGAMDSRWACGRDDSEGSGGSGQAAQQEQQQHKARRRAAGAMSIEGDDSFSSSSSSAAGGPGLSSTPSAGLGSSRAATSTEVQKGQLQEEDGDELIQDPFPTPPGVHFPRTPVPLAAAAAGGPVTSSLMMMTTLSTPFPSRDSSSGGTGQLHLAPLASAWTAVSSGAGAGVVPLHPPSTVVHLPARAWTSLCDTWNVSSSSDLTSPATRLHAYLQSKGLAS